MEVARNYEDHDEQKATGSPKEGVIEVVEEPEVLVEPPPLEAVEEKSLETS